MIVGEAPFEEARAFTAVVVSWFGAQLTKVLTGWFKTRKFNFRWLFNTGGMPSAHSASVTSVATATGLYFGFGSIIFLVVLVFTIITMFDAAGVRRNVGRQAIILNKILDELYEKGAVREGRLKELLGHTPVEVFAGALLGIVVAYILCTF